MSKVIECWRLEAKGDTSNRLIARFFYRASATECGNLMSIQPNTVGYGPVIEKEVIEIFANTLDWSTKEEALAKLSEKEKRVLGLI